MGKITKSTIAAGLASIVLLLSGCPLLPPPNNAPTLEPEKTSIIINEGQIVAQNTIEALTQAVQKNNSMAHPHQQVRVYLKVSRPSENFKSFLDYQSYISSINFKGSQYEIQCDNDEKHFEDILKNVIDQKLGFQEFRKEQLLLEDVFVKLTQNNISGVTDV